MLIVSTLRLSKGGPFNYSLYAGIIRYGREIVYQCAHKHVNRDQSTHKHYSARDCAIDALRIVNSKDSGCALLAKIEG